MVACKACSSTSKIVSGYSAFVFLMGLAAPMKSARWWSCLLPATTLLGVASFCSHVFKTAAIRPMVRGFVTVSVLSTSGLASSSPTFVRQRRRCRLRVVGHCRTPTSMLFGTFVSKSGCFKQPVMALCPAQLPWCLYADPQVRNLFGRHPRGPRLRRYGVGNRKKRERERGRRKRQGQECHFTAVLSSQSAATGLRCPVA